MSRFLIAACVGLAALCGALARAEEPLRVGSKRFTESYILGEVVVQAARAGGAPAEHRQGLGNTAILVEALRSGAIDAYPEYSGTIVREILRIDGTSTAAQFEAALAREGFAAGVPFGFQDTYALAMRAADAKRLGIARLSDLAAHGDLRLGLSHEFLGREDGWRGLAARYGLSALRPVALDHGLAYDALAAGRVDIVDAYTTDARIARDGLVLLADDRDYFPRYDAMLLYRADVPARHPVAWRAVSALAGRIDGARMARLNAAAEIERRDLASIAADVVAGPRAAQAGNPAQGARTFASILFTRESLRLLREHVALVLASLAAAVAVGIPLGVVAARWRPLAQPVLLAVGLLQTVPSLALLAFLIPLTGAIGWWPAAIALFLYGLLPIVRNTHAGLQGVRTGIVEAARALGLRPGTVLARIELPLAAPTIVAGIKTAAVIDVGTATIAAFIGAGGFGERIAQGLALNDHAMLLAGAVPAAALALVFHIGFEALERAMLPRKARDR
jgi:osmoprotectant transport system permease protein